MLIYCDFFDPTLHIFDVLIVNQEIVWLLEMGTKSKFQIAFKIVSLIFRGLCMLVS